MGNLPSPQNERDQLEKQLLGEMQATWDTYHAAAEEYANIRDEFSDMLDHPDGSYAVNQAAKKERVALENYALAVRAFTKLTVCGPSPIPSDDPEL